MDAKLRNLERAADAGDRQAFDALHVERDRAGRLLEILSGSSWNQVGSWIFDSWAGRRRIDGVEHHGPVFNLGGRERASKTQARACRCLVCRGE